MAGTLYIDPKNIAGTDKQTATPSLYDFTSGGTDFSNLVKGGLTNLTGLAGAGLNYQGVGSAVGTPVLGAATETAATLGTSGVTPRTSAADASAARTQQNLRDYLDRIGTTRTQGVAGIGDEKNKALSESNLSRSRALEDFATRRLDTEGARDKALGNVDRNARTLADSVRRILGLASGSGSSAFQLAAPSAIGRYASQQRGDVLGQYGQNFRDLATSEGRATKDFELQQKSIEDEYRKRERDFLASLLEKEQQAYADINDATNVNAKQAELDALFNQYRTPYSVSPVNVNVPKLSDYVVDPATINRQQGVTQDPYSQSIRKRFEDQLA